MQSYDYLIVGAGLSGATFARLMTEHGKRCLVIERRSHIGGNIYDEKSEGISVHQYGPHIFHTADEEVWRFINRFSEFNHFVANPIANYKGTYYNLPFNMNTFYRLWGCGTPEEAKNKIAEQVKKSGITNPKNLEEQAIMLVGNDIYEILIKGYTEKQWGRPCNELPAFIIKRLPVRFTYDNNYFNHPYQGIPKQGYTEMIHSMLEGIDVELEVDFLEGKEKYESIANKIFYTGTIDSYYEYCFGALEYRSLCFETELLDMPNYQGVFGVNYTDSDTPYTRIIEHKHFLFGQGNDEKTIITKEFPLQWTLGKEPYYPINDEKNAELYQRYKKENEKNQHIIFGGRLGQYQYFDMDQAIKNTFHIVKRILN